MTSRGSPGRYAIYLENHEKYAIYSETLAIYVICHGSPGTYVICHENHAIYASCLGIPEKYVTSLGNQEKCLESPEVSVSEGQDREAGRRGLGRRAGGVLVEESERGGKGREWMFEQLIGND